jgi:hypothetical protein
VSTLTIETFVEALLTSDSGLWGFLAAWRELFDVFHVAPEPENRILFEEFTHALVKFGYHLSPQFVELLFRTYDRGNQGSLSFDLFVQACISLKRMTDVFKRYDEDRDGYITLSLYVVYMGVLIFYDSNNILARNSLPVGNLYSSSIVSIHIRSIAQKS